MKNVLLLLCICMVCCNNASELTLTKDYTDKHREAFDFCKRNDFNTRYYFLLDMSLHSGKSRFFVYDFALQKISDQKLVAHGSCDVLEINKTKWEKARFSNAIDSHCSALGKYRIGTRDHSGWGIKIKYWLHGLDASNSNAEKRVVVLHSWSAVGDKEVYPDYTPLSWGCPAVSDDFMRRLDKMLQESSKPVLLWVVD